MSDPLAPGLTLAERLRLADESNNPKGWRGRIAAYAPGKKKEATR